MKVVPKNPPGHALGWCLFRDASAPGGRTGTCVGFFVKAGFALTPSGATNLVASDDVFPTGDLPHGEAALGTRYPSDFVPRKPLGEVIVVGTAHPPKGTALTRYPVRVAVGDWWKTITVHGERRWTTGGLFDVPGPAAIAGATPLTFARAFGGASVAANPLGFGVDGDEVPNLEHPTRPISGRHAGGDPAGLGPIPSDWPQRRQYLGMPGKTGVSSWWPWSPPQFDARFWMATLPDQWIDGYFRGDEPLELLHLHPEHAEWRASLPGQRARVFVLRLHDDTPLSAARHDRLDHAETKFEEVPLVLDTVFIDADAGTMTLVWRGSTPVRSAKLLDILGVSFGLEPLGEDRDAQAYLNPLLAAESTPALVAPDRAAILADIEAAIAERKAAQAAVEADMAAQLAAVKADVATKLAEARAGHDAAVGRLAAAFSPAEQAAVRDACVFLPTDPFTADPPPGGPSMHEVAADLRRQADALLPVPGDQPTAMQAPSLDAVRSRAGVLRESAQGLEEAAALQAGFMGEFEASKQALLATFPPELLADRAIRPGDPLDLAAIRRDGLAGFDLRGVDFTGLDLAGVSFRGVQAAGARFARARLEGADFTRANLTEADLTDADLTAAVLEHADLTAAVVQGAVWRQARISGVFLAGLDLQGADFSAASGKYADFSSAQLVGSCFRGAVLDRPSFRASRADQADFSAADLRLADFGSASCRKADFTDAKLPNIRAREAADFTGARLERVCADDACWNTSILDGADFQDADLRRADFSECSLDGTNLDRCDLANANFSDSTIHAALITAANLLRASFDRATIVDVRFDGSSLFEAGFWEASLGGATFVGSDVSRALLPPRA
ncbi:MAG: DUF2169 domain-containing protein [Planctomycetia bacterium]|nr:DUF2169 domain-containing protein [Planctomycetia bacterium]